MLKLSKSSISSQEVKSVQNVLKQQYLGMGPQVKKFEKKLSKFFNRNVLCVNSGTAALHLALQACGIKKGDEVLVPCVTYVATYQAVSATGAKIIFCDVDPKNLTIELKDVYKKITKKTKAIIPVHFSGHPCNLTEIYKFSKKNNLRVIEDSAHAFGSIYKKKKIGSQGDINCFSFDGIKNITSGEGGCVVTNDKEILKKVNDARVLGVCKEGYKKYKKERNWDMQVVDQGWRYHMSDINAAIGISQLSRFKLLSKQRQKIAKFYDQELNLQNNFVQKFERNFTNEVPHIYCVILNKRINRNMLVKRLKKSGIETGMHYKPGYELRYYKSSKKNYPNCEKIKNTILSIPLHPDLTLAQSKFIINRLLKFSKELIK